MKEPIFKGKELKERELKDREVKLKQRQKSYFWNQLLSINDIGKFEQKEMNKIRPINNTWCDWVNSLYFWSYKKKCRWF